MVWYGFLRLMRKRGLLLFAISFISPYSPKRRLRAKVCHTSSEADTTPVPMHTHWLMPARKRMTNRTKMASSPPAKINRYCALSPLNSTDWPIPLLMLYSAIFLFLLYLIIICV